MVEEQVCEVCGGTGFRVVQRGGMDAAERCDCWGRDRAQRLIERAQIPPKQMSKSFENFSTLPENPVTSRILQTALTTAGSYAREYPAGVRKKGLLFAGGPGTGKTHLAVAVMRRLIQRGFECVFFDYQGLLQSLRDSYDPASGAASKEAYRRALECEILVLDDLGAHRVSDWVEDTITSIINQRYNEEKALIATTNLRDPEAGDQALPSGTAGDIAGRYYLSERIGFRARSRLFEMCRVISLRGAEDYRTRREG